MPERDICQTQFKGAMPNPYWLAATTHERDAHGHPAPSAPMRVYLCKEHRGVFDAVLGRATRRERNRVLKGESFLTAQVKNKGLWAVPPHE
jgi:hypothetical protein